MKPTLKLSRPLVVEAWRVVAKVGLAAEREWEPAVLRHVADDGGTTVDRLAAHLLNGRKAIAERLLRGCVALGLLHDERGAFRLTDSGLAAAETGLLLIPEEGTWTLWFSPDPLLPSPVVGLEPYREPSTYDDQQRARRNEAPRKMVPVPDAVRAIAGKTVPLLQGKHRSARFDELQPKGEEGELGGTRLVVNVEISGQRTLASMRGKLGTSDLDVRLPPPALSYDAAWTALLAAAGVLERWDRANEVLRVAFDETTAQERATFRRDLAARRPMIGPWGRFDDTVIQQVSVAPRSAADAAAWARWRLVQSIQDTATRGRFADWSREAAAPFAGAGLLMPTRGELAAQVRGAERPGPVYWRLQAAEDWNL